MLADVAEVVEIVGKIRPILAGRDPSVQGATLADLLALWLAGHDEAAREPLLELHIRTVRDLIPINEQWLRPRQ